MINEKGITLLETLIVVAFIGIILLVSVPLTVRLIQRYRCEKQIRTIYSSCMEARQRAMQRNIPYLLRFDTRKFEVYEDQNRDGNPDAIERVDVLSLGTIAPTDFSMVGIVGGAPITPTPQVATANERGLVQPDVMIRIDNNDSPYNCMVTSLTRIGLGKYASTCQVK